MESGGPANQTMRDSTTTMDRPSDTVTICLRKVLKDLELGLVFRLFIDLIHMQSTWLSRPSISHTSYPTQESLEPIPVNSRLRAPGMDGVEKRLHFRRHHYMTFEDGIRGHRYHLRVLCSFITRSFQMCLRSPLFGPETWGQIHQVPCAL